MRIVPNDLKNLILIHVFSVNKIVTAFINNRYHRWFVNKVFLQLLDRTDPADVKVSLKLLDLKPLYAIWVVHLYNDIYQEKETITKQFDATAISGTIGNALYIFKKYRKYVYRINLNLSYWNIFFYLLKHFLWKKNCFFTSNYFCCYTSRTFVNFSVTSCLIFEKALLVAYDLFLFSKQKVLQLVLFTRLFSSLDFFWIKILIRQNS